MRKNERRPLREPMTNEHEAKILDDFAAAVGYEDVKRLVLNILKDAVKELVLGDEAFGRDILYGLRCYIDALALAAGDENTEHAELAALAAMERYCDDHGKEKEKNMKYDIGHEPSLEPRAPKAVLYCDVCDAPIYEGDEYFKTPWGDVCDDCMDGFSAVAEDGDYD